MRNTSETVLGPQYTPWPSYCQYTNLGDYCGPHTASSVFLILMHHMGVTIRTGGSWWYFTGSWRGAGYYPINAIILINIEEI